MMKKLLIPFAVVLGIFLYVFPACSQDQDTVFKVDAFGGLQRPVAVFDHDAHNEMAGLEDCSACHHMYEDGKLVAGESSEDSACSDCHELDSVGNQPGLMDAYHAQCKNCHEDQGKGPITCGECHVR